VRLWSLHPRHLDARGLVALWREGLLARAVLRGETKGYRHHPQLARFAAHASPRSAINAYLRAVYEEAVERGYEFDASKIGPSRSIARIAVPRGQIVHEWRHLLGKLSARSPTIHARWRDVVRPSSHPLFRVRPGPVAEWERTS
jgi:hypothetical protein